MWLANLQQFIDGQIAVVGATTGDGSACVVGFNEQPLFESIESCFVCMDTSSFYSLRFLIAPVDILYSFFKLCYSWPGIPDVIEVVSSCIKSSGLLCIDDHCVYTLRIITRESQEAQFIRSNH